MSTITPVSFLDDGVSIASRLPQGLDTQRVAQWVSHGSLSDTSAYTGSFVDDDDDDMALRGGEISDRPLGSKRGDESKKQGGERVWNKNAKRAVSGDVRRHVDKIRDLRGRVQVKKVKSSGKVEKERVLVPVPRQWGTFVIKSADGRIIVVDEEGEFDSGPQQVKGGEKQQERRWVRAASPAEPSSPLPVIARESLPAVDERMDPNWSPGRTEKAWRGHEKDEWIRGQDWARPLTPIPESEDDHTPLPSVREASRSPIDLMAAVAGWKDNSQTSTTGDSHSSSGSINDEGWVSPSRLPHPFTWVSSRSNSHDRWSRGPRATDNPAWTDRELSLLQQNDFNDNTPSSSEAA